MVKAIHAILMILAVVLIASLTTWVLLDQTPEPIREHTEPAEDLGNLVLEIQAPENQTLNTS
ncbi:MAG: hypothetical protein ABIF10_00785 [Candidatus Woesearchaeota archaeon]